MPATIFAAALLALIPPTNNALESVVSTSSIIRRVEIRGTKLPVDLTTQVGQAYNARNIQQDVRRMWSTGRFEDIRAAAALQPDGLAVTFQVVESRAWRLRKTAIEPSNLGVKFTLPEGSRIDRQRAQALAQEARKRLTAEGYTDAMVDPQIVPVAHGQADLHVNITPGGRIRVTRVDFAGATVIPAHELRRNLRALRTRHILGWPLHPAYSPEAVEADISRLRSLYFSKGYLDAELRLESSEIQLSNARITISTEPGSLYQIVEGRPCDVCAALLRARRDAERQGILDFSATVAVRRFEENPSRPTASLTSSLNLGKPYRVGRIEFTGNRHFSDTLLRRNFLLDEGQPLDELLLRKSIGRLNRSGLFEPIDESEVVIRTDESTGLADVTVRLKERKTGAWRLSGPVGPASFAGPLEASISSRLPTWGSGVLELATYTASISVFAFARPIFPLMALSPKRPFLPVLMFARPFSPGEGWKSGLYVVPQLGWRATAVTYPVTQVQHRLLSALDGDRGLTPELPVTIDDPKGDGVLLCEPPPQHLAKLRLISTIMLRFAGALSGI